MAQLGHKKQASARLMRLMHVSKHQHNQAQLQAGAEFFPRAISCTQATQTDSINSIASAG